MTRLADLPSAEPSAARAARIRQRCHAQLARRARRTATTAGRASRPADTGRLWQPTLALLALAYVAEVLGLAFSLYRR